MATAKVKVVLNTASPEATKDQIVAEFKSRDANAAVDIVRDSFGKVVAVYLDNVLESAADQARAAVLVNKGVATVSPVIPKQFAITDLNDIAGIAWTGTFDPVAYQQIFVVPADDVESNFGTLKKEGYVDGVEYLDAKAAIISFMNVNSVNPFTIASNSVSLKYHGLTTPLVISLTSSIVIPVPSAQYIPCFNAYYITTDGKLYLALRVVNGAVVEGIYTFEEAVANGAK